VAKTGGRMSESGLGGQSVFGEKPGWKEGEAEFGRKNEVDIGRGKLILTKKKKEGKYM